MKVLGSEERRDGWVPKGRGVTTEVRRALSDLWLLLGREAETRDTAGGLGSIELSCGCCLCRKPEEGVFTSACVPDKGRLGSGTFRTTVVISSVLTVLVYSETGLLCTRSATGEWDLWEEPRLVVVMVVVMVASLPAGLSTMSAFRKVGGEAALRVDGATAGGSSSFRGGSGDSEEEYGVSIV